MLSRYRRALAVPALLFGAGAACGGGSGQPDAQTVNFDRPALLANVGQDIVVPLYRRFDTGAEALASAVDGYCAALATAGETDALATAQGAWREAMVAWQTAEVMLFGPVAMDDGTLRDQIYSWPVVSSCAVDQDVVLKRDDPDYDITTRLVNRRGLDALEYLLFAASLDTTCTPATAPAGWDALPEAERRALRCAYAGDAAADLAAHAQSVVDAWDPAAGNFLANFTGAGRSGSSFDSAQGALNAVSDAMFYLDSEVKDMKLGQPAGITMNRCGAMQAPCELELESPHARHSRENIAANLAGFQTLYTGEVAGAGKGLGFEDFLRAAGADALADTMKADIAAAVAAIDAVPAPLADALTSDYDEVTAAHAAVKRVTDNLKSQFLTVLGLDIPDDAAADND